MDFNYPGNSSFKSVNPESIDTKPGWVLFMLWKEGILWLEKVLLSLNFL
jgi:hypothetical protein